MRVLMLTSGASLLDGINRHIANIAPSINDANGFEVAVCSAHYDGELTETLRKKNVRTYTLNVGSGHDIRIIWRFARVLRDFKPEIIHIHNLAIAERLVISICGSNIKLVQTIHGIADPVTRESLRQKLERLLVKFMPLPKIHKLYISEGVRRHYGGVGPVIYNPIEVSRPRTVRKLHRELGLLDGTPIIGTACRFAAVKQPLVFVDVMCHVLEQIPTAHAVLIGDGDESIKQGMKAKISQYQMDDRMHWMGYREDAPELVGEVDMFVLTSKREGMPTALLEAMSQNAPVAFLKGEGGLTDLAGKDLHYGGIAVVEESVSDLLTGIVKCLRDKELARIMTARAMAVVKESFSLEAITSQLTNYYKIVWEKNENDSI